MKWETIPYDDGGGHWFRCFFPFGEIAVEYVPWHEGEHKWFRSWYAPGDCDPREAEWFATDAEARASAKDWLDTKIARCGNVSAASEPRIDEE